MCSSCPLSWKPHFNDCFSPSFGTHCWAVTNGTACSSLPSPLQLGWVELTCDHKRLQGCLVSHNSVTGQREKLLILFSAALLLQWWNVNKYNYLSTVILGEFAVHFLSLLFFSLDGNIEFLLRHVHLKAEFTGYFVYKSCKYLTWGTILS